MVYIALDIETTGLNWRKDKILFVGSFPESDMHFPDELQCIWHNGSFDLKFLKQNGITKAKIDHDTYLLASLLPHDKRGLLDLIKHYNLASPEDLAFMEEAKKQRNNMSEMNSERLKKYCLLDCQYTLRLYHKFKEMLDKAPKEQMFYYTYLLPSYRLLINTEMHGICIDLPRISNLLTKTEVELKQLQQNMRALVFDYIDMEEKLWLSESIQALKKPDKNTGTSYKRYLDRVQKRKDKAKSFNWNSPQQVLWLLNDCLKLECINYSGELSIGEAVLQNLKTEHPLIPLLLKYKELQKLKTAFLDRWKNDAFDSKLYTTYDITGTRTGRLSSSNPNLQQVPRDKNIRSLFIAREGYSLICSDYAQIEPRVAAHYAKDDLLTWVFNTKIDLYGQIACDILGFKGHPNEVKAKDPNLRQLAKTIMLAMSYGVGPKKLQWIIKNNLNETLSYDRCLEIVKNFTHTYPSLERLKQALLKTVTDRKGKIYNLYNRPLFLTEQQYHKVFNTLIQSTASDICLFKQLDIKKVFDKEKIDGTLVLLNHDECVYEVKDEQLDKAASLIKNIMEHSPLRNIPLDVDQKIGKTWGK